MIAIVNKYHYLQSDFSESKDGKKLGTYDGHLTVTISWGKDGSNPLRDEAIRKIAQEMIHKLNYFQVTLGTTSDGRFAKTITVLYLKKNERRKTFNAIKELAKKFF